MAWQRMIFFWKWRPRDQHQDSGVWGEGEAERHLRRKGYSIIGRRVRVGSRDEIDLVASHRRILVFVEVKTRRTEDFGRPVESVDRKKRLNLSRAAIRYLKALKQRPDHFRFDVVEVIGQSGVAERIRHIENAFNLESRYKVPW